jgi:hypothetical protein
MGRQIFGPMLDDLAVVTVVVTLLSVGAFLYALSFLCGDWEDD